VTSCGFVGSLALVSGQAMDPPHTRIIKIDILVSLALEPAAIEVVLKELRTYIRNADKKFVCAAIRAVGRVAELARIVYDRHGAKTGDATKERSTANRIALDCLYGLAVVTETCDNKLVVGEAIVSMQNILAMLGSDAGENGSLMQVEDPNSVQSFALRRVLLLLAQTLSSRVKEEKEEEEDEGSDDEEDAEPSELEKITLELPPRAVASALSMVGDWLSNIHRATLSLKSVDGNAKSNMRLELIRLLVRAFPDLDNCEKEQGINLASKFLVSNSSGVAASSAKEAAACEHILSMGRVDVNPDVKDRARFESAILHATVGLKHDTDALEVSPSIGGGDLTVETAKRMLLDRKPAPSFLPVEDDETVVTKSFRFGSLSSLVGHRARCYLSLPQWAEKNSPKALRDPVEAAKEQVAPNFTKQPGASGFYDGGGGDSSSSDDDSSSSSSESSDGQNADSESESGSSDDSSTSAGGVNLLGGQATGMQNNLFDSNPMQPMGQVASAPVPMMQPYVTTTASSDDDDSSSSGGSSSSYSSDSAGDYNGDVSSANTLSKAADGNLLGTGGMASSGAGALTNGSSSAMDDLKGLVMAPVAVDESQDVDPNIETDSGAWMELVRPELCAGLSVMGRYLRGPTRKREAQLKGLDPDSPTVVCLQVQFGNK
jgi:AP-3 complex subunit beta